MEKLLDSKYPFSQAPLLYDMNGLEPHMSGETMSFHYGKHHVAYINKANGMLEGKEEAQHCMLDLLIMAKKDPSKLGLFNNLAQHYNHSIFWASMKPQGGDSSISDQLKDALEAQFGSMESLKEQFTTLGMGQFGSGWVWLTFKDGQFHLMKTLNADTPIIDGHQVLMTCDVWEHAYYLDHQNKRDQYLSVFWDKLANWEYAENQWAQVA